MRPEHNKRIFAAWDPASDVLVLDATPLLASNDPIVTKYLPWAYALNTAAGLYRLHISEKFLGKNKLFLETPTSSSCLFHDVTVWATNFYKSFMIVSLHDTMQTILIDSRGTMYEIPGYRGRYGTEGTVEMKKREGHYLLNGSFKIKYRSIAEQEEFEKLTVPSTTVSISKAFNRFVRNNAHNDQPYLYLTAGESKCGALVTHFAKNGMQYEPVPNLLDDDKTVNVRIPLNKENIARKDVQFLCAKYSNTYAIYNIPYVYIGGGLELPKAWKKAHYSLDFSMPVDKEPLVYSIINTFRLITGSDDDYEVYKKTLSKVVRLLTKVKPTTYPNCFSDQLLKHPYDVHASGDYISQNQDYICSLLGFASSSQIDEAKYQKAYSISKQQYKQALLQYESAVLQEIVASGGKISRWVNESTLFTTVKKLYSDAIYQYRSPWLGQQSLDVFIPSLNLGIEYQGEQHYRPIDLFGGEEGFRNLIERDLRKEMLCQKNGVTLLKWKYTEELSSVKVQQRILQVLK